MSQISHILNDPQESHSSLNIRMCQSHQNTRFTQMSCVQIEDATLAGLFCQICLNPGVWLYEGAASKQATG